METTGQQSNSEFFNLIKKEEREGEEKEFRRIAGKSSGTPVDFRWGIAEKEAK